MEHHPQDLSSAESLLYHLQSLEARLQRIETHLGLEVQEKVKEYLPSQREEISPPAQHGTLATQTDDKLELEIGEFWFAKIGIIVLAVGIIFLLTLPYPDYPAFLPSVAGVVIAGGIFGLSFLWRTSYAFLSRYLLGGGMILVFFSTMRLYYFSPQPAIGEKWLVVALLLLLSGVNIIIALRRNSVYLTAIHLAACFVTATIAEQAYVLFAITLLLSTLVVYLVLKFQWRNLLFFGMFLAYFAHLHWFLNNPILTGSFEFATTPMVGLYIPLVIAAIFSLPVLFRADKTTEDVITIGSTFFNCAGVYSVYLLITFTSFRDELVIAHTLASALFLSLSIIFWLRVKSKYSTFFYAMLGYTALSVALIGAFEPPNVFIYLSWQSMLVVSTAIWFRSKFIVVANFFIYLITFFAYLTLTNEIGGISLGFGVVALLSARILNAQRNRLELQTDKMRLAYLVCAFFIFPYTLYYIVPSGFIALSWIGVAAVYYAMSLLLQNEKYRWMALLTLALTVLYVFIIGIALLEPTYRIISFLGLGFALVVISLLYTKKRLKK